MVCHNCRCVSALAQARKIIADFVNACADRKPAQPTFADGLQNQRALAAVEESVKKRGWVKL